MNHYSELTIACLFFLIKLMSLRIKKMRDGERYDDLLSSLSRLTGTFW